MTRRVPRLAALALLGATVLSSALAPPALAAQDAPPPPVSWFFELEVPPANQLAFNSAMEEWMERVAEDGETWVWNVFEAVTGPSEYVVMTPFHDFADFDRGPIVDQSRQEDNNEWFAENMAPTVTDVHSRMMMLNADWSVPYAGDEPPPLWQVIEYEWTDNSTEAYLAVGNVMGKVKEAFEAMLAEAPADAGPMAYNIFELMYGDGPGGVLIALPLMDFASLDGGDPLGFFDGMAATHGHEDAVMIDRTLSKYLKPVSANIYAHRMDLSYDPGM